MNTSDLYHVILHVTDFHLSKIGVGATDFLRAGYYKEYLRNMWAAMKPLVPGKVDLIVATGDFVDRSEVHNFEHAAAILRELAKVVELDESRVAVCIGNHDVVREKDTKGHHDQARAAFHEFAKTFHAKRVVHSSKRASLLSYDNDLYCLMLDGTLGTSDTDAPGSLDVAGIDDLVNNFVKLVPDDKTLIVGSHYPMSTFPDDFSQKMEGPDYIRRHFWADAISFKKRVTDLRQKAITLWLFGDVHHPDAYSEGLHYHVVTGRFGTRIPELPRKDSLQPRQCRAIALPSDSGNSCKLITGNFLLDSHTPQQEHGTWSPSPSLFRRTALALPTVDKVEAAAPIWVGPTDKYGSTKHAEAPAISMLDKNLNSLIYEKVRNEGLYRMGRFRTCGDRDSLGWVSVGQILGSGEYLARFCSASLFWLEKSFNIQPHINGTGFLFLGIDCWGASIASILAAACGSKALCVAARADGRYHTVGELVDKDVTDSIKQSEVVVVTTDVIATGHSITSLYERVREIDSEAIRAEQRWIALSVLIDSNRQSLSMCPFLAGIGVGCVDIKLPGVPCSMLPGDDIAPPTVSFL